MRKIYPNEKYCMGCGICRIHCALSAAGTDDLLKAYRLNKLPSSRIRVDENLIDKKHPLMFAIQCIQCEQPECVESCLTGAIHKDLKTGVVIINKDKCIGCWTCVLACPYSCIFPDISVSKRAVKCELCLDKESPPCVAGCPNNALIVEDERA